MMHRNLDRRVEVLVQVKDHKLTAQLDELFESALDPSTRRSGTRGPMGSGPRRQRKVKACGTTKYR